MILDALYRPPSISEVILVLDLKCDPIHVDERAAPVCSGRNRIPHRVTEPIRLARIETESAVRRIVHHVERADDVAFGWPEFRIVDGIGASLPALRGDATAEIASGVDIQVQQHADFVVAQTVSVKVGQQVQGVVDQERMNVSFVPSIWYLYVVAASFTSL